MQKLLYVLITAIPGLVFCFLTIKEDKERRKAEKELREKIEHENKAAEIISEANKTKSDAISGDIDNDLSYMAGKLHEYAGK